MPPPAVRLDPWRAPGGVSQAVAPCGPAPLAAPAEPPSASVVMPSKSKPPSPLGPPPWRPVPVQKSRPDERGPTPPPMLPLAKYRVGRVDGVEPWDPEWETESSTPCSTTRQVIFVRNPEWSSETSSSEYSVIQLVPSDDKGKGKNKGKEGKVSLIPNDQTAACLRDALGSYGRWTTAEQRLGVPKLSSAEIEYLVTGKGKGTDKGTVQGKGTDKGTDKGKGKDKGKDKGHAQSPRNVD